MRWFRLPTSVVLIAIQACSGGSALTQETSDLMLPGPPRGCFAQVSIVASQTNIDGCENPPQYTNPQQGAVAVVGEVEGAGGEVKCNLSHSWKMGAFEYSWRFFLMKPAFRGNVQCVLSGCSSPRVGFAETEIAANPDLQDVVEMSWYQAPMKPLASDGITWKNGRPTLSMSGEQGTVWEKCETPVPRAFE